MTDSAAKPHAIDIPKPDFTKRVSTEALLNEIVLDLYRVASGQPPIIPLPFSVIAEPTTAAAVLRDERRFAKEYRFLEMLAQGRFTANGQNWRRRAALTQPFYRRASETLTEAAIQQMYESAMQRRMKHSGVELFECFIDGAVAVMSTCMGLTEPLPWPAAAAAKARATLKIPLCVSLCGHGAESSSSVRDSLAAFFSRIEAAWLERDEVRSLLRGLETHGAAIDGFNAVGELIQNVMAATETTASALMWCVECLARYPAAWDMIDRLDAPHGIDVFIDEVLRLFPPIPMVMRRCKEAGDVLGVSFRANDVFAISFVGLHCHPDHWTSPLAFSPDREEWRLPPAERSAYHPFSHGPRICGGARLALMEMRAGLRAFGRLFATGTMSAPLAIDFGLTSRPHRRIEEFVRPATDSKL